MCEYVYTQYWKGIADQVIKCWGPTTLTPLAPLTPHQMMWASGHTYVDIHECWGPTTLSPAHVCVDVHIIDICKMTYMSGRAWELGRPIHIFVGERYTHQYSFSHTCAVHVLCVFIDTHPWICIRYTRKHTSSHRYNTHTNTHQHTCAHTHPYTHELQTHDVCVCVGGGGRSPKTAHTVFWVSFGSPLGIFWFTCFFFKIHCQTRNRVHTRCT